MATHRRLVVKEGPDYYQTPTWATAAFLRHEHFQGSILDCCCGRGHMSVVLDRVYPGRIIASDLYDRGYGTPHVDFLNTEIYNNGVDNIVINPPFNLAEDFLEKALAITRRKVCMLLRLAFLEGADRYASVYQARAPARVWVHSERVSMYKGDFTGDRDQGGSTAFAWFVFDKQATNKDPILKFIPPYYKPTRGRKRRHKQPLIFRFSRQYAIEKALKEPFDVG